MNIADIYRKVAAKAMEKPFSGRYEKERDEIMAQLEALHRMNLDAYLSLKMNIGATYQNVAAEAMEKTFLGWQESGYLIYRVAPGVEDAVAYYVRKVCDDIADTHIVIAPDHSHAAVYQRDSEEYMIASRCLFKQADVEDVLETFQGWLQPRVEGRSEKTNALNLSELDFAAMFDDAEEDV